MDAIRIQPDPYEMFNIAVGYRVGDLVVLSGQAAVDEQGQVVGAGDFDAQAEQVFANLSSALGNAGSSLEQVVKVTVYLTDMAYFPNVLELRKRFFTPPYPADTLVEVAGLALPELMIEIEAIALAGEGRVRDPD